MEGGWGRGWNTLRPTVVNHIDSMYPRYGNTGMSLYFAGLLTQTR